MPPVIPTGEKPGQRPYAPLKLIVTLLYGIVPGVTRLSPGRCLIQVKPLAVYLRTTGVRLKDTARTLEKWGLLSELQIDRATILLTVAEPRIWRDDESDDFSETN